MQTAEAVSGEKQSARPLRRSDLVAYADSLGLDVTHNASDEALANMVEQRLRLIESLPLDLLAEIAAWANLPVPANGNKLELAGHISRLTHTRFPGLSTQALRALAELRGCLIEPDATREQIARKIKAREGLWAKFRRKRRAFFGNLIAGMVGDTHDHTLPDELRPFTLKERIEQEGIVSGLKQRLRGAADDYVRQKLDEIEARIDRKLDEIDHRLADWRDKEILNRLRIVRITLIASILVAMLSLGYTLIKAWFPSLPLP